MLFVIKGLSKGTLKGITAAGESISQSFIKNTQDLKIKILLVFFSFFWIFFQLYLKISRKTVFFFVKLIFSQCLML